MARATCSPLPLNGPSQDGTRKRGYGARTADFGGHFEKTRRESDDQRDSIAGPISAWNAVMAVANLTWIHKAATVEQIVKPCLPHLTQVTREISIKPETA